MTQGFKQPSHMRDHGLKKVKGKYNECCVFLVTDITYPHKTGREPKGRFQSVLLLYYYWRIGSVTVQFKNKPRHYQK